jgi:V/A-type H+-transporting ATPase subunit D
MAKIKLTKNELKKKKDALKMYQRYLPTLQLKKQQLQTEIRGIEARMAELRERREALDREFSAWVSVFTEEGRARGAGGRPLLAVTEVRTEVGNIAGVRIPVFEGAEFALEEYDLFETPLWVDRALELLKSALLVDLEHRVVKEQRDLLAAELRTTTQRVNLFEKVKIPETLSDIKRIRIYLGDQQTAQVVRGKIAKKKVEGVEA